MFKSTIDIKWFGWLSALFLFFSVLAVSLDEWTILLLPFGAVFFFWLANRLSLLFHLLIASIPWSFEFYTESFATDLPDEPLMLLVSLVVIFLWVYNYRRIEINKKYSFLLLVLGLQLGWACISTGFSINQVFSVKYLLAKSWFLLAFVAAPLILFSSKKNIITAAYTLTISMFLATVVVMVRHAFRGFSFSTINDAAWPLFRNHVNYSSLLVCIVPLVLLFVFTTKNKTWKRVGWAAVIFLLAAIYFSYARGAWLALITGAGAFYLLRKKLLFYGFVFAVLITALVVFWLRSNERYVQYAHDYNTTVFHEDFSSHWSATYQMKDISTAERFYRWVAGVRMVNDYWHTGSGPSTFYPAYKQYTIPAFKTWVSNNPERSTVHNYYLLTLIEQGVMGLLLLLILLGAMFYTAEKIYWRSGDVAWKNVALIASVLLTMICTLNFLSDLIETDKVGSVFYICLALLVIANRQLASGSDLPANIQRIP